jgi:hypothetical protein
VADFVFPGLRKDRAYDVFLSIAFCMISAAKNRISEQMQRFFAGRLD